MKRPRFYSDRIFYKKKNQVLFFIQFSHQVLCSGKFQWEFSSNGVIPEHAVPISTSEEGETLYAGRVLHKGAQTVGKVCSLQK